MNFRGRLERAIFPSESKYVDGSNGGCTTCCVIFEISFGADGTIFYFKGPEYLPGKMPVSFSGKSVFEIMIGSVFIF